MTTHPICVLSEVDVDRVTHPYPSEHDNPPHMFILCSVRWMWIASPTPTLASMTTHPICVLSEVDVDRVTHPYPSEHDNPPHMCSQ